MCTSYGTYVSFCISVWKFHAAICTIFICNGRRWKLLGAHVSLSGVLSFFGHHFKFFECLGQPNSAFPAASDNFLYTLLLILELSFGTIYIGKLANKGVAEEMLDIMNKANVSWWCKAFYIKVLIKLFYLSTLEQIFSFVCRQSERTCWTEITHLVKIDTQWCNFQKMLGNETCSRDAQSSTYTRTCRRPRHTPSCRNSIVVFFCSKLEAAHPGNVQLFCTYMGSFSQNFIGGEFGLHRVPVFCI